MKAIKKNAAKQYIKTMLQKTLLPLCYNAGVLFLKPDSRLILFADSNGDTLDERMRLLKNELASRGYSCEEWCLDFSKAGMITMLSYLCRFMFRFSRARALVICNYFLPANACKKRRSTKVVQLWHSCGALKKFGYSTPNDISKDFHGSVSRNFDLVTVSSPYCVRFFEEAFSLPPGIARPAGVSSTDVFFDKGYEARCKAKLYEKYPQLKNKRLLLYLPTFRGDASHAYTVGTEEIRRLELGENWFVAVRTHPRVTPPTDDLPGLETNELLVCADMLISDYSSAVFEYALLDRPMLLWCPDLEEYLDERDFYLDFVNAMPCPIVSSSDKLNAAVCDTLKGFENGKYIGFVKKYMSACDGNATKRIADFIVKKGKEI